MTYQAVLFDLDGTLVDSANDICITLNKIRALNNLPPCALSEIKPLVSIGSKALLKHALDIEENDANYSKLKANFLKLYEQQITETTAFFPEVMEMLGRLNQLEIPWGIVTNRLTQHTEAILKTLVFEKHPVCVVNGDTLSNRKPHPEPLLHGCALLQSNPQHTLYVGDAETDVLASKAAGMDVVVALYGYIHPAVDPQSWCAKGYIDTPLALIDWLR